MQYLPSTTLCITKDDYRPCFNHLSKSANGKRLNVSKLTRNAPTEDQAPSRTVIF